MKVVADKRIPGFEEAIRTHRPDIRLIVREGADISRDDVKDADALIVRTRTRCDAALLEGSKVLLVGTATIGTDHIDTEWCAKNGIRVVNAPGCNAPAVMQYVASSLDKAGFDPRHHTLGVVGKGNIGSLVSDLYRREGTKVLVCDPPRQLAGYEDEQYRTLEYVLENSDAVTFHVPYTVDGPHPTRHLLKNPLPARPGIYVNASRGPVFAPSVIDSSKKFIIDTWPFEEEPLDFTPEEIRRLIGEAFIATPHIAGYSIEGKRRATAAMLALFGIPCDAETGKREYSLKDVIDSFNPLALSESLKNSPSSFERLRASHLRPEP